MGGVWGWWARTSVTRLITSDEILEENTNEGFLCFVSEIQSSLHQWGSWKSHKTTHLFGSWFHWNQRCKHSGCVCTSHRHWHYCSRHWGCTPPSQSRYLWRLWDQLEIEKGIQKAQSLCQCQCLSSAVRGPLIAGKQQEPRMIEKGSKWSISSSVNPQPLSIGCSKHEWWYCQRATKTVTHVKCTFRKQKEGS